MDFPTWLTNRMELLNIKDWRDLQSRLAARELRRSGAAIRSWLSTGDDGRTPRLYALGVLLDVLAVDDLKERGLIYDLAARRRQSAA